MVQNMYVKEHSGGTGHPSYFWFQVLKILYFLCFLVFNKYNIYLHKWSFTFIWRMTLSALFLVQGMALLVFLLIWRVPFLGRDSIFFLNHIFFGAGGFFLVFLRFWDFWNFLIHLFFLFFKYSDLFSFWCFFYFYNFPGQFSFWRRGSI